MRISRTTGAAIIGAVIALIGVIAWEAVYRIGA
jgi:hypothetical protein